MFDSDVHRHDTLFSDVADALRKQNVRVSGAECKARFATLQLKFRQEYEKTRETGSAPSKWGLYDLFLEMEGPNAVNLEAPVVVSAGCKSLVKRSQEIVGAIRRGKERPPSSSRQEKLAQKLVGNRPIGPKQRALSLQERKLTVEEKFHDEFAAYRREAGERSAIIREGLTILKEIQQNKQN